MRPERQKKMKVLFGCLPGCGICTIGTVTGAVGAGLVTPRIPCLTGGLHVAEVRPFNAASYLHAANAAVSVPGPGDIRVDLACGGNFSATLEPQPDWPGPDHMPTARIVADPRFRGVQRWLFSLRQRPGNA
jgi:4-hydroxyproline epimerase